MESMVCVVTMTLLFESFIFREKNWNIWEIVEKIVFLIYYFLLLAVQGNKIQNVLNVRFIGIGIYFY